MAMKKVNTSSGKVEDMSGKMVEEYYSEVTETIVGQHNTPIEEPLTESVAAPANSIAPEQSMPQAADPELEVIYTFEVPDYLTPDEKWMEKNASLLVDMEVKWMAKDDTLSFHLNRGWNRCVGHPEHHDLALCYRRKVIAEAEARYTEQKCREGEGSTDAELEKMEENFLQTGEFGHGPGRELLIRNQTMTRAGESAQSQSGYDPEYIAWKRARTGGIGRRLF